MRHAHAAVPFLAGFLALGGSLGAAGCSKAAATAEQTHGDDAKITVSAPTMTVSEQSVDDWLTLTGSLAAERSAAVAADVGGRVLSVSVERGQHVKTGDILVRIDRRTATLSAAEARAQLEVARAQATQAKAQCASNDLLLKRGAITQIQYETEAAQCRASIESANAAEVRVRMASKTLADGTVRAPFEGFVAEKLVEPGEYVNIGKPLVSLVTKKRLRLDLTVSEVDIGKVHEGADVVFSVIAYPGKQFRAKVTRLGADLGERRSLVVEAEVEAAEGLLPGMFADARLSLGKIRRPVIPEAAIRTVGETARVFVVDDGVLEERIVGLGEELDGQRVILENLSQGDTIVAAVDDEVVDGAVLSGARASGKPVSKPVARQGTGPAAATAKTAEQAARPAVPGPAQPKSSQASNE